MAIWRDRVCLRERVCVCVGRLRANWTKSDTMSPTLISTTNNYLISVWRVCKSKWHIIHQSCYNINNPKIILMMQKVYSRRWHYVVVVSLPAIRHPSAYLDDDCYEALVLCWFSIFDNLLHKVWQNICAWAEHVMHIHIVAEEKKKKIPRFPHNRLGMVWIEKATCFISTRTQYTHIAELRPNWLNQFSCRIICVMLYCWHAYLRRFAWRAFRNDCFCIPAWRCATMRVKWGRFPEKIKYSTVFG